MTMPYKDKRSAEPRQCPFCGNTFHPIIRQLRKGKGLYCSVACSIRHKPRRPKALMTTEQRFWRHVDVNGPMPENAALGHCWEWTGSFTGSGRWRYGRLGKTNSSNWQDIYAHRVSWEIHAGPIPEGGVIRHKCDRPGCVNPAHLALGTHADNTHDMHERDRTPLGRFNAEKVRMARARYEDGERIYKLAADYGVTRGTMSRMLRRITWKHVV
jgi:hypothetical protein